MPSTEETMRTLNQSLATHPIAARAAAFVALLAVPALGWAGISGPPNPVPEPEILALVGIGAVALMIARWKKRK
jgi:PEP-CTERM motif